MTDHSDNWDALFSSEIPHGYEFKLSCTVFPPEVSSTHSEQSEFAAAQGKCIATFLLLPSSQYDPTVCIIFTDQTFIWEIAELDCSPTHITQIAADATVFYKLPSLVHSQFSQLALSCMVMVKQQTSEETCNQNGAEETIIACFPASVRELHLG